MTHIELAKKMELRDITFDDVISWEHEMGESFLDYHGSEINTVLFAGFLIAKEPELTPLILKEVNNKYTEVQNYSDDILDTKYDYESDKTFEYAHNDEAQYMLMKYLLELINLTGATKMRVLYILTNKICNSVDWNAEPSEDD